MIPNTLVGFLMIIYFLSPTNIVCGIARRYYYNLIILFIISESIYK